MEKVKVICAKAYPWDKEECFLADDVSVKTGDWVVIKTELGHLEAAPVTEVKEVSKDKVGESERSIVRPASLDDLEKVKEKNKKKQQTLAECKQVVRKYNLPMKLVDCQFSFDGGKLIFAFTSETRVDFRDLVKELTRHFQKTIRLQQIGSRDETKQVGKLGPCGRILCCKAFLDDLGNITTDLARIQHVEQRGSDRLSGACSRLKCCLNYEAQGYEECSVALPPIGSQIKTESGQKGDVVSWNVLRHSVDVRLEDGTYTKECFDCEKVGCPGCKYKK